MLLQLKRESNCSSHPASLQEQAGAVEAGFVLKRDSNCSSRPASLTAHLVLLQTGAVEAEVCVGRREA